MAQRPRTLQPHLSDNHRLGARLRSLRESRNLSQAKLGELVFCSGHLIGKIEKAERRAQPDLIERCDRALEANGELTELITEGTANREAAYADAELIETRRTQHEQMYRRVGGVALSPRIEAFVRSTVVPVLQAGARGREGLRLRSAASGLAAVAGICAYDTHRHERARKHFQRAIDLADDDRAFTGYVSALMANQALCLNEHQLAIGIADATLRAGRGWLSAALRTDLHAMQAKAYAKMGLRAECVSELGRAEMVAGQIAFENEPLETSYVHPGLLELKHAEALLELGDLVQAQGLAETSMALGPPDPRGHFYAYATLAQVLAARQQIEESLVWTENALVVAGGMESWRVTDRLRIVVESLVPYRNVAAVRNLIMRAGLMLSVPC